MWVIRGREAKRKESGALPKHGAGEEWLEALRACAELLKKKGEKMSMKTPSLQRGSTSLLTGEVLRLVTGGGSKFKSKQKMDSGAFRKASHRIPVSKTSRAWSLLRAERRG